MPQENSFFSKCKNQITKCVCPLENLQGMNYIALTINVGSSSENAKNAGNAPSKNLTHTHVYNKVDNAF